MLKQEAINILAQNKGPAISVATMQAAAPWHDTGSGKSMHVDASGCMGSASALGLGLALGRPDRRVMILDGDGSLLMQLGSLVTIASLAPKNLYHFVFANGLYESSGNQPVPGQGVFDFCKLALGAGYAAAFAFSTADTFAADIPKVFATDGPVMIKLDIARDNATPRWPGIRMAGQVRTLKEQLAGL
jgi:phosphonopyruvate decarboxylase